MKHERPALDELRRRYASSEQPPKPSALRALRADPRAGARALVETLTARAKAARRESARLLRLSAREMELRAEGFAHVAGVDEVGMGPLAGPVIAAAVVLPVDVHLPGLDDSKLLTRAARERLARAIEAVAVDFAVGRVDPDELDRVNVYQAGLLAMRRAVLALSRAPDALLVDARRIPGVDCRQESPKQGDRLVAAIAAASIVAKVARDALMTELDRHHPGYGFAKNAGYGTAEHLAALAALGPSPVHRWSFAPVRAAARR